MAIEFKPMRSMIFTDLAKEQYRHKLLKWHMLHVEDSIAQFEPYVMKYAFYAAYPVHILIIYLIRKETVGF